jgi:hypothetical protein
MGEIAGEGDRGKDLTRLLLGRVCCLVGLLLSLVGGIVLAVLGTSVNLSAGTVGVALGIVGYLLGERRMGAATIVLGVVAIFFVAAVSTGLIPGVASPGHGYQ